MASDLPPQCQCDDPELDGTDWQHPAFTRGVDYAVTILYGKINTWLDNQERSGLMASPELNRIKMRIHDLISSRGETRFTLCLSAILNAILLVLVVLLYRGLL